MPNSPARPVLAPVETGEELLLVSPAREVRLEWKVGRFSLLPAEGVTLGGSTQSIVHGPPEPPRGREHVRHQQPQQKDFDIEETLILTVKENTSCCFSSG